MNLTNTDNKTTISYFPQLAQIEQPEDKPPPIKVNGVAKISSYVRDFGIETVINGKKIRLRYPPSIWARFPQIHKKILSENVAYGHTFHLPHIFLSLKKMVYNIPVPLSESYFFKSYSLSLPSTAIMQQTKKDRVTSDYLRRLFDVDYIFKSTKTDIPPYNRTSLSDRIIMPFTFGKDSLLTFAIAKELNMKVYPVYISEPDYPYEAHIKKQLSIPFRKEFRVKIYFLKNNLGILRERFGWTGWELQLTHYSLMLLPYVYSKKAGYILFSNEQSCNDTIIDFDGFRCNPVYEQSHGWLLQNSLMTSLIGGNSLSIGSLIEPVNELAIMRILHRRYPEYAKYQSSCDMEEKSKHNGRWCESCSKCARMYIFLLAVGTNPKILGFRRNMMALKYGHLFPIFDNKAIKAYGYDQSLAGKNEQILAFLIAYKKGIRGPLMTHFARKYLKFALKNERNLRKKYFGIHSSKTVPSLFKNKVMRIFHQELDHLL